MFKRNNKIKKLAINKTVKQVKKEINRLKKSGKKIDPKKIEEYVKTLYEENLKKMINSKQKLSKNSEFKIL
jgi:hypothetical protein